jgi:hypothetical protein
MDGMRWSRCQFRRIISGPLMGDRSSLDLAHFTFTSFSSYSILTHSLSLYHSQTDGSRICSRRLPQDDCQRWEAWTASGPYPSVFQGYYQVSAKNARARYVPISSLMLVVCVGVDVQNAWERRGLRMWAHCLAVEARTHSRVIPPRRFWSWCSLDRLLPSKATNWITLTNRLNLTIFLPFGLIHFFTTHYRIHWWIRNYWRSQSGQDCHWIDWPSQQVRCYLTSIRCWIWWNRKVDCQSFAQSPVWTHSH